MNLAKALNAFKALKTPGFLRQTTLTSNKSFIITSSSSSKNSSVFSRFYSSFNSRDSLEKPEVIIHEEGERVELEPELPEPVAGDGSQHLEPVDPSGQTKCESITDRLRRLSQTSPEDFVPTAQTPEERDQVKARYKETLRQYRQRFAQKDRQRYGNPNFRGGRQDAWDDHNQYRRYTTSAFKDHDPDTFGTLSLGSVSIKDSVGAAVRKELIEDEKALGLSMLDDDEEDDSRFIPTDKWNMKKLVKRVKELVDEKKVKDAVDTLTGALAQGGFHYDAGDLVYCYNLCISACGQVGYVEMAFKLFNDMKKRGFPNKQSTYTSLFNACANSPWDSEKNIERMNRLRNNMAEKAVPLNQINYHSMIKGYGRCGDLETAFSIVDEMITLEKLRPTTETFNMLLQACISNKYNGFRHVLVTWRKMQSMQIRPDLFSYNLLLRAVRECGIQLQLPEEEESQSSDQMNKKKTRKQKSEPAAVRLVDIPRLSPVVTEDESNDMLNLICLNDSEKALTNINSEAAVICTYEDVIQALALPENRLSILGGLRGLISQMAVDKVGPNMKTVIELAQLINPEDASDLIMLLKSYKLKPNLDFFNLLIKRSYIMNKDKHAKALLKLLPEYGLTPNIMTWGVSAIGCRNWYTAKNLLMEMDAAEVVPNIEIMGALVSSACSSFDPKYVLRMMGEMKRREVIPDAKLIVQIEQFKQTVRKGIVSQEMGKQIEPLKLKTALENNWDEVSWKNFLLRYQRWMEGTKIRVELESKNPWTEDFETFRKYRSHNIVRDAEEQATATSNAKIARNNVRSESF